MKSSFLAAGLALLALTLPCSAQEPAPPTPPAPPNAAPPPKKKEVEVTCPDQVPTFNPPAIVLEDQLVGNPITPPQYPHVYVDMEGVLWWLKPNNINAPLVTSLKAPENLASSVTAGGLADPNTVVLFGQQDFRTDPQTGGRVRIGAALDTEATELFEVSGFYLPWQVERFFGQSDAAGNPALALPYNQVFPGAPVEAASIVAGQFGGQTLTGNVLINNGTEMWGAEANFIKMLDTTCVGEFDLIVGLRFIYFEDYLTIDATTNGVGSTHDSFDAKNSFYGGQIGLRHTLDCENWRFETNAKLALGDTNEELDINGSSNLPLNPAAGKVPGGFYTASSNIGDTSRNCFGVVAELGFTVAYKLTDNIQLTAGYTYLYWNQLERSGNQIDHNINPALNPALSTINPSGGPSSPQRLNAESTFWAQGISVGMRFAF